MGAVVPPEEDDMAKHENSRKRRRQARAAKSAARSRTAMVCGELAQPGLIDARVAGAVADNAARHGHVMTAAMFRAIERRA